MKTYAYWLFGLVIVGQSVSPGYASPLTPSVNHKIHQGKTDLVAKRVWFFRPDGVEIDESNFINQCTAERPCKKLTQDFVDNLTNFLKSNHLKGKLWLATGVYDLTANPEQNFASVLNLNERISIEGRTSDFSHIAYNDERPQINGTLSWNDSAHNKDSRASVANIRMHTNENRILINGTFINVNIYSAGDLEVTNSDLQKTNTEDGGNIQANFVLLTETTLSSKGESAVNITSSGAYVVGSQLHIRGSNTHNLEIAKGSLAIYRSNLTNKVDACTGAANHSTAIKSDSSDLHLVSSRIVMESAIKCPAANMTAIAANAIPYISIQDSEILMKSADEELVAIASNYFPVTLTGSHINIQSSNGQAYAFRNYHTTLEFIGKPSTIQVSSPILAALYEISKIITISNHSYPLSQCKLNEELQKNC